MDLLVVSFLAGVLTAAAPCVLPLLPVIVGGSVLSGDEDEDRRSLRHPLTIVISLAVSIIVFSLLLKTTTALLGIPDDVWSILAGGVVVLFGITLLWPSIWDRLMVATGISAGANNLLDRSRDETGIKRDILLGAALGPVFNSCSPTYALIIAVTFPASFAEGFINLIAYAAGLALILLLISLFGRAVVDRLNWLSDPHGTFRKVVGALFLVVGFGVIFGLDRDLQAWILENGWYDPVQDVEGSLN
ncbi:MAG TPA: cytochrome c biogenesis protein CcdA [Solirubrobacterales bacterium]|nr:cytochrome c biogenesis protein CcdA [Solirubrobacterales bacterium]